MKYQVVLDLSVVLPKVKHLKVKLEKFDKISAVLSLEATDPDDACYLAYKEFCDHVIAQSDNSKTKDLLKELKYDFMVVTLIIE